MSVMDEYAGFTRLGEQPGVPTQPTESDISQWTSSQGEQSALATTKPGAVMGGEFDGFEQVTSPSLAHDVSTMAQAGTAEAIRGTGFITGAGIGGKIGGAATLGHPAGVIVGGLVGGVIGASVGDRARMELGLQAAEEAPPEDQMFANIGSVIGGAAFPATGTAMMARTGFRFGPIPGALQKPSIVGQTVNDLADFASQSKVWGSREAWMTALSAAGGGFAGAVAPDNQLARFGSEIAFPLAHQALWSAGSGTIRSGMNLWRMVGKEGQQNVAATFLRHAYERADGDPVVFMRMLQDFKKTNPEFDSAYLTPGQITGDISAINIEKSLQQINAKFGARAAESAEAGLSAVREQIGLYTAIGTPESLQIASQMRVKYYEMMHDMLLRTSTDEAIDAVIRLTDVGELKPSEISRVAYESLESSLKTVIEIEKDLWGKIDRTVEAGLDNFNIMYQSMQSDTSSAKFNIPKYVSNFFNKYRQLGFNPTTLTTGYKKSTAGEMMQLRSDLLADARTASKNDDYNAARILNNLAESLLDDIDAAFTGSTSNDAYTAARQFTKAKHDSFSRTFAGEARAEGKYGNRIDPEVLLRRAMSSGREVTSLRMAELQQATQFIETQGYAAHESYDIMINAQEKMLRVLTADAFDPATGKISVSKLKNFKNKYSEILDKEHFSGVKRALDDAIQFSSHREEMAAVAKGESANIRKNTMISQFMNEPPVQKSMKILQKTARDQELQKTITQLRQDLSGNIIDSTTGQSRPMTRQEKDDALSGFVSSLLDAAIIKSTSKTTIGEQATNVVSPQMFRSMLFDPPTVGGSSIMDVLINEKLIPKERVADIERILNLASNIQRYKDTKPTGIENEFSTELAILLSRMTGSGLVGWVAKKTKVGSSIIIHGAAARYGQNVATKLPQNSIINILTDAFSDPTNDWEKLRLLMTRSNDPLVQIQNSRQLHAWFTRAGYLNTAEIVKEQMNMINLIHDTSYDQGEQQ